MSDFFERLLAADCAVDLVAAAWHEHPDLPSGPQLTLEFVVQVWDDVAGVAQSETPTTERWRVVASGVTEHHLRFGDVDLSLDPNAAPLRCVRLPWAKLSYSAAPAHPEQLRADLRAAHDPAKWGKASNYLFESDLSFGMGVLAEGPLPLLEGYAAALQAHQMRPAIFAQRPHRDHYLAAPEVYLQFEAPVGQTWANYYVLASHLDVQPLPALTP